MHVAIQPIINTPDLDRLLNFYTALFGAVEKYRIPDTEPTFYIGLEVDDFELGLVIARDAETGTTGRVLLSFDVENVDALLERVEAVGGRVLGPPNDMPWGQRVAHIQDPDGNAVNLTQQL
ncbi:VOC family protein [Saccharopolyspora phatthalungensis]|uniref:Putative enzyme related to lactoylglutathione lyase n=1 Tax=Saccharopolyspora phatthalungensis TaxID=664693 RepID=A0A840Q9X5_9PSEU|nr:VOC family protein [Saccharopolyspora phatthalungensis]MBB5156747.1 putative enzyme related to lactoylglutathione lyase [Saccharopolyspora phatthalungensis]